METREECAHVQGNVWINVKVFFERAFDTALLWTGHSSQEVCQAALRVNLFIKKEFLK